MAPDFAAALAGMNVGAVDQQVHPVYGLSADHRLSYFNVGWFEFAWANGGQAMLDQWKRGRSLFDAIPPLLEFYRLGFERVRLSRLPWEHRYECSSPTERRWFGMRVLPVRDGGMLVVNGLASAEPITAESSGVLLEDYLQPGHLIVQCSHCRRVRQMGTAERWDFVPELVARVPALASHGLCGTCLAYHYPIEDDDQDD